MRIALGYGDGIFDVADHPFEDFAAAVHAMLGRDLGGRGFDRVAFGERGLVIGARAIELALIDPAKLHRQRVAHDVQPDADQDHEPRDRRLVILRHVGRERHAGQRRDVGGPCIDGLRRDELRRARRLFCGRVVLRQRGRRGRHRRRRRGGGGGKRRHRIRHGVAPVGRETCRALLDRAYRRTWLIFRKPSDPDRSLEP